MRIEKLNEYLRIRPQKVLERPKQYMDSDNPKRPVKMIGFRPRRSDIRLQYNTVNACVKKNNDC